MKRTPEGFDWLIAELRSDIEDMGKVEEANNQAVARIAAGARSYLDWAALGYTIHNIFGVIEGYCLRFSTRRRPCSSTSCAVSGMCFDVEFIDKLLRIKALLADDRNTGS